MKNSTFIWLFTVSVLVCAVFAFYIKPEPSYIKERVILSYDPAKFTPVTSLKLPCFEKPAKLVTNAKENVLIYDCDGDDNPDWASKNEVVFQLIATDLETEHYGSQHLNAIRFSQPPRICPDGKKDYGDLEKDSTGILRLYYCGTPEPILPPFLSMQSQFGKTLTDMFKKLSP